MRKHKRWESEQEIIDAIDQTRHDQNVLIEQAYSNEQNAKKFCEMCEDKRIPIQERRAYEQEAKKMFEQSRKKLKSATHKDTKAKKLSEVLAAFRTNLLPIEGNTDLAVV